MTGKPYIVGEGAGGEWQFVCTHDPQDVMYSEGAAREAKRQGFRLLLCQACMCVVRMRCVQVETINGQHLVKGHRN